jgi:phage portal protein BeeE
MTITNTVKQLWQQLAGEEIAVAAAASTRKTAVLPSIFNPQRNGQAMTLKPTPANLRKFAETPIARRAINVVKDRIASMDWQIRIRRGYTDIDVPDAQLRMNALRRSLEEPNAADSFRVLWEQVLEDLLVGGFGAVEMETTGDPSQPFQLWPIDGATIQVDGQWNGDAATPRYAQSLGNLSTNKQIPLLDSELMYIRLNPRTHTCFGLGRLEVAFESITQFLAAHRYAGRLASNSVVQYALWLNEATPEQHDRLIRWWQDEIEGTGRVPLLSCEQKPEVLRFAGGTDADLRLAWQEFLILMIANAFDLPPMLLGLQKDVNRSTASEMADEAFASAIVPVAKLLAEHITRDIFAKKLGWREFEFCFNDLESRNEIEELQIQTELLKAGVLTVAEVRKQRGMMPLPTLADREIAAPVEVEVTL